MAGALQIQGNSAGDSAGTRQLGPISIAGGAQAGETIVSALISGDNTFEVPAGAVATVIIPPPTGTVMLTLRTSLNPGDAGLPVSGTLPTVYVFPATPPTTLILNASGPQTLPVNIWFW